jgi:nitroreductase
MPEREGFNPATFINLVRKRRSARSYSPRSVPRDMIDKCLEAVRYAPTACNTQAWRFIVTEGELKDRIARECFGQFPVPNKWIAEAPVIVVLVSERNLITHRIGSGLKKTRYDLIDAGIAGEHFVLQAAELGLGTCWLGWFKKRKAKKILNLRPGCDITAMITVGFTDMDNSEKERKQLREISEYRS